MISILYSAQDYEAASIALKLQSLSHGQAVRVYIVPKHYGRNEAGIAQNLNKTQAALFLAYETTCVDDATLNELAILRHRGVPIRYVLPVSFNPGQIPAEASEVFRYHANSMSNETLLRDLSQTITSLNMQVTQRNFTAPKDKMSIALVGVMVGLSLILLGMVASSGNADNSHSTN